MLNYLTAFESDKPSFKNVFSNHLPNRAIYRLINRPFIFIFLWCFLLSFPLTAIAQPKTEPPLVIINDVAHLSESEVLEMAAAIKSNNKEKYRALVNVAFEKAMQKNNVAVAAQAQSLLGQYYRDLKKTNSAMQHFLQASELYKEVSEPSKQITAALEYAKLNLKKRDYNEVHKITDSLVTLAQGLEDKRALEKILTLKANTYYKQKHYDDAILKYSEAVEYLKAAGEEAQGPLALTYHRIAQSYKQLRNREKSVFYYRKALDEYTAMGFSKAIARTYANLAREERYRTNYLVALDYAIRGLEVHKTIDDKKGFMKSVMGLGMIYRKLGRYEESLEQMLKAQNYYKEINDVYGVADTSNQIGLIYSRLKQFEQARYFYLQTIDLPQEKIPNKTIATACREMAIIDLNAGDYDTAMLYATKAHRIYESQSNKVKGSITARIIGNIYRAQGASAKAINYYRQSIAFSKEVGDLLYLIKAQTKLALELIDKDIDESYSLLTNSLQIAIEKAYKLEEITVHHGLRMVSEKQANFEQALEHAKKEISLANIIRSEDELSELTRQRAILDSRKLELELISLREKAKSDQLELLKKESEIEILGQAKKIEQLELASNEYNSWQLGVIFILVLLLAYREFCCQRKMK